jgi:hypothetical protein
MNDRAIDRLALAAVILVPLVYYGLFISRGITFGDGPEILTAVILHGVTHPSGYPLYTLLGQPFVHLPWASPHYNLAFFLSAVPGAVACGLIYATLRRLEVRVEVAAPTALAFAFTESVIIQSTRVEVYALHCALIALTFYGLVRYQRLLEDRWLYVAILGLCLALTNHLTSALLVIPTALGLIWTGKTKILRAEVLLTAFSIGVACAAVYVYLPLSAMANDADRITWNSPMTLDLFWFHVTGAEYNIYRSTTNILPSLNSFVTYANRSFFGGALFVLVPAFPIAARREWKLAVPVALYIVAMLAYTCTFDVSDIATYFSGVFLASLLVVGLALDQALKWRPAKLKGPVAAGVIAAVLVSGPIALATKNRSIRHLHVLAQDMSDDVVDRLPDRAIIFTSVDGHTFPLWYQAYVLHPDRELVVIDRVLFRLENKDWYRAFLRARHPDVIWPSDELIFTTQLTGRWDKFLIDNNRDRYPPFAMAASQWTVQGTYLVNDGWHHRIVVPEPGVPPTPATEHGMHIYMAEWAKRGHYFRNSRRRYAIPTENLACIAEWWRHNDLTTRWIFRGPGGAEHVVKEHPVPSGTTLSWDFIKPEWQTPGMWTCDVEVNGRVDLSLPFELVADDKAN